jgi:hypothetical protein
MFAFDALSELEKIARVAPGSHVWVRVLMACEGAEWPLSRKFGCEPAMAMDLLVQAKVLGLIPYGISFHVGSQQTDLTQVRVICTLFNLIYTHGQPVHPRIITNDVPALAIAQLLSMVMNHYYLTEVWVMASATSVTHWSRHRSEDYHS